MNINIDVRGKSCPIPVIMAKKEVDNNNDDFTIIVDNQTAVENLKRFASSSGYEIVINEIDKDFKIDFLKSNTTNNECQLVPSIINNGWAVFVGKEGIGEGDSELGETLLKMFFYTLMQDDNIPKYALFMNSGVKVPVENKQIVEHLKELQEKGTEILVCGTCLNFYGIADKLKVGTISNMYDIVGAMKVVDTVITL